MIYNGPILKLISSSNNAESPSEIGGKTSFNAGDGVALEMLPYS